MFNKNKKYQKGRIYEYGLNHTDKDLDKAIEYYIQGANERDIDSMVALYHIYMNMTKHTQLKQEKEEYFQQAYSWIEYATYQEALSASVHGTTLFMRQDNFQDREEGYKYIAFARKSGVRLIENDLCYADAHLYGYGTPVDYQICFQVYNEIIDGYSTPMLVSIYADSVAYCYECLGYMYENGYGVEQDMSKAYECYRSSYGFGNENVKNKMNKLIQDT